MNLSIVPNNILVSMIPFKSLFCFVFTTTVFGIYMRTLKFKEKGARTVALMNKESLEVIAPL